MANRVSLYGLSMIVHGGGGEIMIGSSGNSGGVVVGALVCGTECSGLKSRFILGFFFSLVEIFLCSCEPFHHGASIACCNSNFYYGRRYSSDL